MAEVKPYKGLRFRCKNAGNIDELVCPPYDIISEEQRCAYLQQNPHNIIRLELPKGETPYATAGETLESWLECGILQIEEKPSLYIYEEEFTVGGITRSFKGVIGRVKIEEFSKGIILPHEETLSKAKEDRFNLMKATGCNFSQIYSLFNDEQHEITAMLDELSQAAPDLELTDGEQVTHRLWIVSDESSVDAVCSAFAEKKLYIADGHHRYETALNYRNYCRENHIGTGGEDYVMMMLVDMEHPGLLVLPTHRVLHDLPSFDLQALLSKCADYFDITDCPSEEAIETCLAEQYANGKKAFVLYTNSAIKLLVLRDGSVMESLLPGKSRAYCRLDVSVLHSLVLERLFGIDAENMAQQINLTYVKKTEEAIAQVHSGQAQCAFLLNPTRVEEIRDVAAAGEKMPQKSTYFYPKLITGLVMNDLSK